MLLETRGLCIGYPGRRVAGNIGIGVRPGTVLCLLGPNGCGKTTLFRTILGLLPPLAGSVVYAGVPLPRLSRGEIACKVAYVPQAHAATFPFRVRDIVLMGRTSHRGAFAAPSREDRDSTDQALAQLGIEDLAEREYTRISGGQRQLVLIARALAQAAPVIVMDEPTASLDFGNQAMVLARIKALAARGLAVVLSTHDPDHAFAVADTVVFLNDGGVAAQGAPQEVLTAARLSSVYGIDVEIVTLPGGHTVCVPHI